MSMWLMYLVIKLNTMQTLCATTLIISVIIVVFIGGVWLDKGAHDDELEGIWKHIRFYLLIPLFALILLIILPTTKQVAAIYFIPKVISNKQVRKMPDKIVKLANSWMDEQIKDIKGKAKT